MRSSQQKGLSMVKSHFKEFSLMNLQKKGLEKMRKSRYGLELNNHLENIKQNKMQFFGYSFVFLGCFFLMRSSLFRSKSKLILGGFTSKAYLPTAYFAEASMRLDKYCCSSAHLMERFQYL